MLVMAAVLLASACTQKLTTPGDCPALCPGGQSAFRDTVIDADVGLDSVYSGYSSPLDAVALLASNGGIYGQSRAVVKFLRRGDSLTVRDTSRSFTIDSVLIQVTLQKRDPTVTDLVLEFYRLPRSFDTTTSFATVDGLMTPENKLGELPIANSAGSGLQQIRLIGADLAKVAFTPLDSTALVIGVRMRASGPSGVRFGSLLSGAESPLFTTFVHANIADTALQRQVINRNPAQNITVRSPDAAPGAGVLPLGGFPASRAFVRFTLPAYIRDSARIIRATLELTTSEPTFGIPGDSTFLDVRAVLSDFGPKSPVASNALGSAVVKPGQTVYSIEVVPVVQLWQGSTPLPSIVRLGITSEQATFLRPLIRSTRAVEGRPRLRLTYRLPFAFEGF